MSDAVVSRDKLFVGAYYDHGMADMDKMRKGMIISWNMGSMKKGPALVDEEAYG